MSDTEIKTLKKILEKQGLDISEIKEVLKGNKEYSENGLAYKVRVDHENRIAKIESKLLYIAGFAIGVSATVSLIASFIFKAFS